VDAFGVFEAFAVNFLDCVRQPPQILLRCVQLARPAHPVAQVRNGPAQVVDLILLRPLGGD